MPQESHPNNSIFSSSPCKNMRGLKALVSNNEAPFANAEEFINDYELAQRKAEEAGTTTMGSVRISFFYFKFSC